MASYLLTPINFEQRTPLMMACIDGNAPLVNAMLQEQYDSFRQVMTKDAYGHTPLMLAILCKSYTCAAILLTHYPIKQLFAMVNGETVLSRIWNERSEVPENIMNFILNVMCMKRDSNGSTMFMVLCSWNRVDVLRCVLGRMNEKVRRSILNSRDNVGRTPLMYSAMFNAYKVVEELMTNWFDDTDKVANVLKMDSRGCNALRLAEQAGAQESIGILMRYVPAVQQTCLEGTGVDVLWTEDTGIIRKKSIDNDYENIMDLASRFSEMWGKT